MSSSTGSRRRVNSRSRSGAPLACDDADRPGVSAERTSFWTPYSPHIGPGYSRSATSRAKSSTRRRDDSRVPPLCLAPREKSPRCSVTAGGVEGEDLTAHNRTRWPSPWPASSRHLRRAPSRERMSWPRRQVEELGMSDTPNHVLVTGAAGLLGREVVAYMRSIGVRVTALLHKPVDLPADRVVVGSTDDVPFVRDAL